MAKHLYKGDCLTELKKLPDCSIASIVADPPYELGFMGKSWDNAGIAYNVKMWSEALRVLKPGGHLLAFGGTRTYHRMSVAIEDAGFEIRDSIHWIYGSGFPKSLDVSKSIDKAAGAEREVVGSATNARSTSGKSALPTVGGDVAYVSWDITAPATVEAQQWQGWGTALKPAHEPIVVARKPLIGTVKANVLEHGTGALNIDGCRVIRGDEEPSGWSITGRKSHKSVAMSSYLGDTPATPDNPNGRWPANIAFDEDAAAELEESRFFYCAKASKKERNAGLDGLPTTTSAELTGLTPGSPGLVMKRQNGTEFANPYAGTSGAEPRANIHPTVKPLALMRWLVRLVTPPGGVVLDPFLGSGTTAVAAILEGFDWKGCEMTEDYWPIIEARTKWARAQVKKGVQKSLFE